MLASTLLFHGFCAYMSKFRATSWPWAVAFRALKVSRRLTGKREDPGIV
jgi:hypothetical protein